MRLDHRELTIPQLGGACSLAEFRREITGRLDGDETPIRFAVTETTASSCRCELGVVSSAAAAPRRPRPDIFCFSPRRFESTSKFTAVLLVPTGIGAELGGHSGDGGALAKYVASACDRLITHPNVVNASDINELPANGLYVEGSVISELMMGNVALQEVRSNRILLITEPREEPAITDMSINTVSAARAAIGTDCVVAELPGRLDMKPAYSESGSAVGCIDRLEPLLGLLDASRGSYDAIALHTGVDVPPAVCEQYFMSKGEMVNPWGGIEAMLTHLLALTLGVPAAHAPMVMTMEEATSQFGVVDPRMASEVISACFLLCVLKGLHRSPRIIRDPSLIVNGGLISNSDISCLIIPDGCIGIPTLAAMEQGIPVIAVRENRNRMRNDLADYPFQPGKLHVVNNYLEAAGVMNALRAGVTIESVRRPIGATRYEAGSLLETPGTAASSRLD
jgi:hypothetical protein